MSEIHRLVRAQLAADAAEVRVRLERARARERSLPIEAKAAKKCASEEVRELSSQLASWVTVMALARIPSELRDGS